MPRVVEVDRRARRRDEFDRGGAPSSDDGPPSDARATRASTTCWIRTTAIAVGVVGDFARRSAPRRASRTRSTPRRASPSPSRATSRPQLDELADDRVGFALRRPRAVDRRARGVGASSTRPRRTVAEPLAAASLAAADRRRLRPRSTLGQHRRRAAPTDGPDRDGGRRCSTGFPEDSWLAFAVADVGAALERGARAALEQRPARDGGADSTGASQRDRASTSARGHALARGPRRVRGRDLAVRPRRRAGARDQRPSGRGRLARPAAAALEREPAGEITPADRRREQGFSLSAPELAERVRGAARRQGGHRRPAPTRSRTSSRRARRSATRMPSTRPPTRSERTYAGALHRLRAARSRVVGSDRRRRRRSDYQAAQPYLDHLDYLIAGTHGRRTAARRVAGSSLARDDVVTRYVLRLASDRRDRDRPARDRAARAGAGAAAAARRAPVHRRRARLRARRGTGPAATSPPASPPRRPR